MEEVILLADQNSKAWQFAEKIQEYLKAKYEANAPPLLNIEISHFNNQEIKMHVPKNLRQKDVYFVHDPALNPQEWWVQLLLTKDLVLNASAKSLSLVLPNMLYSRQDRKHKHHVPISARALASSISPGTKRIITMDLHAAQIQGFYPDTLPVDNLYSFPEASRHLIKFHSDSLEKLVIVSPDFGGAERAESFIKRLEKINQKGSYGLAMIHKKRSKEGSKEGEVEKMELVGDVAERNVLIVDDIIDSGGTICKATELLKKRGAGKIMCYATHGIFSKGKDSLLPYFDAIMSSNTHYIPPNEKIEVVDVSPLFAEAIYRAQNGLSISELFE